MSEDLRPRRSVLYMPASNERALEKAREIGCDGLILDLEDAVAPDAKPAAREAACAAAASGESSVTPTIPSGIEVVYVPREGDARLYVPCVLAVLRFSEPAARPGSRTKDSIS